MSADIHQLIYCSTYQMGRVDSTLKALRDIVATSTRNNAKAQVSGFLVFDGTTFLQILEGPAEAVQSTYSRIGYDPRHRDTVTIQSSTVSQRDFGAWSMGGVLRTPPIPLGLSGAEYMEIAKAMALAQRPAA